MQNKDYKPVILDKEKCNGCVSCMKRCPTEAIRVRNGKATIMYERCIGCGECVKVCPTNAKKECYDTLKEFGEYKHTIVVPSPSLYGQFNNLLDTDFVLTGLKKIGFDTVYEAAYGAELVSAATREYIKHKNVVRPVIGSACSAVTNLILMRYEHLIPHLSPMKAPEVVAAKLALKEVMEKTGLQRDEVGVFVVTQCAAKVLELKNGNATKYIDHVLSVKDVYFKLLGEMNKITVPEKIKKAGKIGVSWGSSSGEAMGLGTENYLACDGIENIIEVLNELEHDKLANLDFLELYACPSGCVGGSMNIENPFLARTRLRKLRKKADESRAVVKNAAEFMRSEPYSPLNIYKLSDDRLTAMKLTMKMKEIYASLPQVDCGACGAPRCLAFAEDVVKGAKVKCKYRSGGDDSQ